MQRDSLQYQSLLKHFLRFSFYLVCMILQIIKLLLKLRNRSLQRRVAWGYAPGIPTALFVECFRWSRSP